MCPDTTGQQSLAEAAASCLGRRLLFWRAAPGGFSPALRLIVRCADGTSVFVKGATDARTATWLRTEYQIYSQVRAPFVPTIRAWQDNGALPFMALEDLSDAVWQAPWTPERVTRVRETLKQVAAAPPPAWLPTLEERRPSFSGWAQVERAPEPFLRLGLCSAGWLASSVAALVAAEAAVQLGGDELVHGDVRSDNLCFVGDRVVLVDWNWASRGNAIIDVAGWLPSLGVEDGPSPDTILPGQPACAAAISGYFAARAGLPVEQATTEIRAVQRAQLQVAMAWAVRALGLASIA